MLIEHESLADVCLKGIQLVLGYKDVNQIASKVWTSGVIQSHVRVYKTKKELNLLHEYKHLNDMLCIISKIVTSDKTFIDMLDKSGCLDIAYDVVTRVYEGVDQEPNLKLLNIALCCLSNIAYDNKYIIKRLINEENGIFFQLFSIITRQIMPQDTIIYFLGLISNCISDDEPQITLSLINLQTIEIISSIMSENNLEECLEPLFSFIKCGEDLINCKIFNHNIALIKYVDLGLTTILEELVLKVSKQQLVFHAKKLISEINKFVDQMSYGNSMDII